MMNKKVFHHPFWGCLLSRYLDQISNLETGFLQHQQANFKTGVAGVGDFFKQKFDFPTSSVETLGRSAGDQLFRDQSATYDADQRGVMSTCARPGICSEFCGKHGWPFWTHMGYEYEELLLYIIV